MTAPQGAPKKSLSFSRIVLLLILVAALGALGWDQLAKYRMGQVYDTLERLSAEGENSTVVGISKDKVHSEIGDREPTRTSTSTDGFQDTEDYDFPGVFYIHRVTVRYRTGIKMYD